MSRAPVLVTIPVSHYCEKARWALDRAGIDYVEAPHVPIVHLSATLPSRTGRTTPQLRTADGVVAESTDILRFADTHGGVGTLFPVDATSRAEVERWVERFDRELGPHTRRYAYFHLLDHGAIVKPLLSHGVPTWQRRVLDLAFPGIRELMRKSMRIDARGSERSRERVAQVFDAVGEALSDGRRYLVGDTFSAADLTFAALAGPLFLPPEHPIPIPPLAELPRSLQTELARLEGHPATAYGRRLYAEHRRERVR